MKKSTVTNMFKAIENKDISTLDAILDAEPDALETVGAHNRLVRDKTPLMFALQCRNLSLANALVDRGADINAVMPGGPESSVLRLCVAFAYSDAANHDDWIVFTKRLLDMGADPNTAIGGALNAFRELSFAYKTPRLELIRLLLDQGADLGCPAGNSGSTLRELVVLNRHLYHEELLRLIGVDTA